MTATTPGTLSAESVSRRFGGRAGTVALDGISVKVRVGETLALVGESGSGKSTLGRILAGLDRPDRGHVLWGDRDISSMSGHERASFRRGVQIVFQDPYASLNPRMTVASMLAEVLTVHGLAEGHEVPRRVGMLLDRVGLDVDSAARYPHEFSGGQRQRIGIARALAVEPTIIIADEPVSALDVSVQAKILALLEELRSDLGLGYLFISHDLAVVRRVADRVAVMHRGRIIEEGLAATVYGAPAEAHTRELLAAVPALPKST
jgi:ABC-type glutathione transport system ATPase component